MYAVENHNLVQNYALLDENNIVTNIIWMADENAPEFPNCKCLGSIPVAVGDQYNLDENKFYRDNKEVKSAEQKALDDAAELEQTLAETVESVYQEDITELGEE